MFGNLKRNNAHELFAEQFEANGSGYLYRQSNKGAPIPVNQAERDAFIAAYARHYRLLLWGPVAGTMLLLFALVSLFPDWKPAESDAHIRVGSLILIGVILIVFRWTWNAPARALARRAPVGPARTKEELRQRLFSRLTYGQLAGGAVVAIGLPWGASGDSDVFHGWGMIWLALSAGFLILVIVQAFRKWRFERSGRRSAG